MEVKKSAQANLERKRILFFEIGLAVSLLLALLAFQWNWGETEDEFESETAVDLVLPPEAQMSAISIEQVQIPAPQQLAPPQISSELKVVKNEVAVKQDIAVPTEADETTEIPDNTPPPPPLPMPDDQVFFQVDELPQFPGGDMALRTFLSNNIRYPKSAYVKKVQGIVYVQFIISKDGKVQSPRVAASVEPSLDSVALAIVSHLPQWVPAKIATAPVNIAVTIPINFILDK